MADGALPRALVSTVRPNPPTVPAAAAAACRAALPAEATLLLAIVGGVGGGGDAAGAFGLRKLMDHHTMRAKPAAMPRKMEMATSPILTRRPSSESGSIDIWKV